MAARKKSARRHVLRKKDVRDRSDSHGQQAIRPLFVVCILAQSRKKCAKVHTTNRCAGVASHEGWDDVDQTTGVQRLKRLPATLYVPMINR